MLNKKLKVSYLHSITAVLLAAFIPQYSLLITIGCLIFVDLFTGIYKAFKLGEEVSSKKMSNTIAKIIFYNISILSGALIQMYIMPAIPFTSIIASSVALIEFTSITENITAILGYNIFKEIKEIIKRKDK